MPNVVKTKTEYPISLSEAKVHLRVDVDYNNDDGYIQSLIKASVREAENYIGKDIALTTNAASIFDFTGDTLTLDEGNLSSVTNVITDVSTLATINVTKTFYNKFQILFPSTITSTTEYTPLTVNYVTGFTADNCPTEIKQAILIKVANMYDVNREDATPSYLNVKDSASNSLLNSHKIILY